MKTNKAHMFSDKELRSLQMVLLSTDMYKINMKPVVALCLALSMAPGLALGQPTAALSQGGGIPVKAPGGWDPSAWTTFRQQCMNLFSEIDRRLHMTTQERESLGPLDMQLRETCLQHIEPPPPVETPSPAGEGRGRSPQ